MYINYIPRNRKPQTRSPARTLGCKECFKYFVHLCVSSRLEKGLPSILVAHANRYGLCIIWNSVVDGYLIEPQWPADLYREGWFYPGDLGVMREGDRLELLSTIATIGAPYDVTLDELRLETLFAGDEATAATLARLAEPAS